MREGGTVNAAQECYLAGSALKQERMAAQSSDGDFILLYGSQTGQVCLRTGAF